ncbi:MAG TPA: iron ABC transporter permease [Methylophaga aminisulfidivorans]|uniref:FecCD family ABC transporter permease n=1 Tax=Methylophaga TaxID=40222 RepID=UPI00176F465C|nr:MULTISPECIES: iron ABC transporter permease [Methylophaga]HIC46620.1 iron ABC transporter permease [Methylophaga sp.]HIM40789.1 iron ABC transporter permease [Methylophaga aminisulfidivorans]
MTSLHKLILITLSSFVVAFAAPWIGLGDIKNVIVQQQILLDIRLPRVLFAFVAGAGLSLCGMVFQAMFHNPLATPFTLGVASGASFGAACTVFLGLNVTLLGFDVITVGAFIGALVAITFVFFISQLQRGFSSETLLLTGVATSFFFSSLILFIQYLSDMTDSFMIMRWLMGGLSSASYHSLLQLIPIVTISTAIILWLSRELNLLMAGDDIALSRGVSVKQVRYLLFFSTSLCVGGIVALCGPIGFIGMMVPHICRLLIGTDHRWLTPATLMFGGGFLILCDAVARLLIAPAEIPVGVITTLLGGPFFLWLLIKRRQR